MDKIIHAIKGHLATQFEQDLFNAAIANLKDTGNALRLNNFAYSMRELTRHFLARLAPDTEVRNAPWFVPDHKDPKLITRDQRIRYAIQGWIKDEYAQKELKLDVEDISSNLRKSINDLSKFTHIEPSTFNVTEPTVFDVSMNILEDSLRFFMEIKEAQARVFHAVCDCVDEEMLSQFYIETQQPLDTIASHYEIEYYTVTSIQQTGQNDSNIFMSASGTVHVRLQYGSNGDLMRDDGYVTHLDFPFSSSFIVSYKNQLGDVHLEDCDMSIDNDTFFE